MQKKNYREEKKRATKELLSTITDPSVIVMADWLKVGTSYTQTFSCTVYYNFTYLSFQRVEGNFVYASVPNNHPLNPTVCFLIVFLLPYLLFGLLVPFVFKTIQFYNLCKLLH